jgi:hypothetical protein
VKQSQTKANGRFTNTIESDMGALIKPSKVLIRPDGSDPKSNVIVVNIGDAGKVTY